MILDLLSSSLLNMKWILQDLTIPLRQYTKIQYQRFIILICSVIICYVLLFNRQHTLHALTPFNVIMLLLTIVSNKCTVTEHHLQDLSNDPNSNLTSMANQNLIIFHTLVDKRPPKHKNCAYYII